MNETPSASVAVSAANETCPDALTVPPSSSTPSVIRLRISAAFAIGPPKLSSPAFWRRWTEYVSALLPPRCQVSPAGRFRTPLFSTELSDCSEPLSPPQ